MIRFLTPDHGKLSAVAKGVRKIKSRSAGHLELFGEVGLMLASGHNLDVVTSARLAWYPHNIASSYDALSLAYAFAALMNQVAGEHHRQPELYAHLREALQAVDQGASGPLIELWYKLRLLHLAGFRPELTRCVVCGEARADSAYRFDAARGGIVCEMCGGTQTMSIATIKFWRLLCDYSYATISRIGDAPELAAVSLTACDEFYEYHIGRTFRPGLSI